MMERIREVSPRFKARITGVVYLLYFLTAIFADILVGHKLVTYGNASNLFATGCYVILTLPFYAMFKAVNRSFSLIAALFSLAGCVVMALGLFHLALFTPSAPCCFWTLLLADRLPYLQVDLPASYSGRAHGISRFGLAGFSVPEPPTLSIALHRGPRHRRRSIADAVAHRNGRERSTME